ncbi:MAG: ribosome silencing factor [Pseudomonadota bacterium]
MTVAAKFSRPPARAALLKVIAAALDDMKAVNIKVMDVRGVTDIADCMVVASGNSDRHVRSIADRVVERARQGGFKPFGVEGARDAEWVLVDLNDVIVHVMLPRVREFYGLEGLWDTAPRTVGRAAARAKVVKPKARVKTAKPKAKGGAKRPAARATGRAPARKSAPRRRATRGPAG